MLSRLPGLAATVAAIAALTTVTTVSSTPTLGAQGPSTTLPNQQPVPIADSGAGANSRTSARAVASSRWDPCSAPYTFKVNTSGLVAKDRRRAVREAKWGVKQLVAASGIEFRFDGTTTEAPSQDGPVRSADLVVAYLSPGQTDYPISDGTVGFGGSWYAGTARFAGYAIVDSPQTTRWPKHRHGGQTRPSVLLHELGHVVGLPHKPVPGLQMNPTVGPQSPATWSPGDLRAFSTVAATHGCVPDAKRIPDPSTP